MNIPSITLVLLLALYWNTPSWAAITESDRQQMDKILGVTGLYTASEDTYAVAFPRTDVPVMVDGRVVSPFLGLTSWAALTSDPHHGGLLLVADLALFEDEVNSVLSDALDNGFEVTAIGSRYLYEKPDVLFMHFSGLGEPADLTTKFRRILKEIKVLRDANPKPASQFTADSVPLKNKINAAALDSVLGMRGQSYDGMYRASIGMRGLVHGIPVGKQMGLRTWIAFAGTDERAIVDGEIVMTRGQVQHVLRSLRNRGIYITALYTPAASEHPEFFFVHYWGKGNALKLARDIRLVLEAQLS